MKSNFDKINEMIDNYLLRSGIKLNYISDLHDTSKNCSDKSLPVVYVFNGKKDIPVIDMDAIAKNGYRVIKNPKENPINTVDAFLVNDLNEWYFIEFKDMTIKADKQALKDNIIKKAYSNWYMLLDILYEMRDTESNFKEFNFNNPVQFAKEHVYYILVCSTEKNPTIYEQIKNHEKMNLKYTPSYLCRLKDYLFKDAYVYTEDFLERKFVNKFTY